jgi:hypothetical protein
VARLVDLDWDEAIKGAASFRSVSYFDLKKSERGGA